MLSRPLRTGLQRCCILLALLAVLLAAGRFSPRAAASPSSVGPSFVEFESGPVRPVAMSPDGSTLFVANTPNGTLEIFDLTSGAPAWRARVPVGLEPVAVAVRSAS